MTAPIESAAEFFLFGLSVYFRVWRKRNSRATTPRSGPRVKKPRLTLGHAFDRLLLDDRVAMYMQHARTAVTAAGIGACGDVLMQWREGHLSAASDVDTGRTARLMSYRLVHAPVVDACWRFFDARSAGLRYGPGVVARVLADQLLLAPPSLIAFFLSQSYLEGGTAEAAAARTRDAFWPTYAICFPFWCCCHSVTFSGKIPVRHRMAWASLCAVMWNALISDQNQRAVSREGAKREGPVQGATEPSG